MAGGPNEPVGLWEPLSNYQLTHMTTVNDGHLIVISARRVDDPVLGKPKPQQGGLMFFDTETGQMTGQHDPVAKAKGAGPIVGVGGNRVLGWTGDPENERGSVLYAVDVDRREAVFAKALPYPLPVAVGSNQQEAWDFRLGPDGMVWTFMGGILVRIDPDDGAIRPVGKAQPPGRIAFSGGTVYLGGTTAVRRLEGVEVAAER